MFGGLHTLWGYYLEAAKAAGFDRRTPLVRCHTLFFEGALVCCIAAACVGRNWIFKRMAPSNRQ